MVIALIFDLDGTMIDVSGSYKEAIVQTVSHLRPNLERKTIYNGMLALRGVSNLNNDWDATYYLLKKLDGEDPKVVRGREWSNIKMIFQAYYLGQDLFFKSYGIAPPIDVDRGLIENETLLIKRSTLERLIEYPKGIVTSRPRIEAMHALKTTFLGEFFDKEMTVCLEDADGEKPDPSPLLKIKEMIKADRYFYVGDNIDDAKAAKNASFTSIIIGEEWGDVHIPDVNSLPKTVSLYDRK